AAAVAVEAEQVAQSITDPDRHALALCELVEALAAAGQYDRAAAVAVDAEQVARSITDPFWQPRALADLVEALAAAGQHDRATAVAVDAEQLARSITNSYWQAQALTDLASIAEPASARSLIADALAVGPWTTPLQELARIDPMALSVFVDEYAPHRPDHPSTR